MAEGAANDEEPVSPAGLDERERREQRAWEAIDRALASLGIGDSLSVYRLCQMLLAEDRVRDAALSHLSKAEDFAERRFGYEPLRLRPRSWVELADRLRFQIRAWREDPPAGVGAVPWARGIVRGAADDCEALGFQPVALDTSDNSSALRAVIAALTEATDDDAAACEVLRILGMHHKAADNRIRGAERVKVSESKRETPKRPRRTKE